MKVSVTKVFTFDAAHQLPWHEGKCRNLHGHTYRFEVTVSGPIDGHGIVIDFDEVSRIVKASVIERYDHTYLNDAFENPTAEILAMEFAKQLEAEGLDVSKLTLWETPTGSATVEAS